MNHLENLKPGVTFMHGQAEVLLWAPQAKSAELYLPATDSRLPLVKRDRGYWHLATDLIVPGDHYQFILDGGEHLPDPASLSQPRGVHGPSEAKDLAAYRWNDTQWINPALTGYLIYELHTGTFTSGGTFAAIEEKLAYLSELGITAIELMPVAAFPGNRNWGYDGVFPYAAHEAYGGMEGLMHLVDACHQKGIAVILDVVYNHMGPEGNYLGSFAPYFTDKYKTPWGGAVNVDDAGSDAVRAYIIQNALMWLRDFHIDALRMDAVHAIKDFGAVHLLQELREETDRLMQQTGRQYHLIIECDLNDVRYINPVAAGGYGMDAQWVDEFHHALRVAAGQDRTGYYTDFDGIVHLAKAYNDAYVYDGIYSPHRNKTFGNKATGKPGQQFIVFSQNHDQVGNRMLGERTGTLLNFELQKVLAAAVLVSPFIPLLFMGEEYGETAPFLYFVSHTDKELAAAVREGRKAEFAAFHAEGEAPDPVAEETFTRSKLQWHLRDQEPHRTMLRYYKKLIALRKELLPMKGTDRSELTAEVLEEKAVRVTRKTADGAITCILNFSNEPLLLPRDARAAIQLLLNSSSSQWGGASATTEATGKPLTVQPQSVLIYQSHV